MNSSVPLRIIINADDLGLNSAVNELIFCLLEAKKISSTTLLANAPASYDALNAVALKKLDCVGIHLNITEFAPLTSGSELRPLLDAQGRFNNSVRNIRITRRLKKAIYAEWSTQIERFLASGVVPSHIDSHHHVHTIPRLLPLLHRLSRTYNISKIRLSMNLFPGGEPKSRALMAKKHVFNRVLRSALGMRTTAAFAPFLQYCQHCKTMERQADLIELMTHPGHPAYAAETAVLLSDWSAAFSRPIRLVSYVDI